MARLRRSPRELAWLSRAACGPSTTRTCGSAPCASIATSFRDGRIAVRLQVDQTPVVRHRGFSFDGRKAAKAGLAAAELLAQFELGALQRLLARRRKFPAGAVDVERQHRQRRAKGPALSAA